MNLRPQLKFRHTGLGGVFTRLRVVPGLQTFAILLWPPATGGSFPYSLKLASTFLSGPVAWPAVPYCGTFPLSTRAKLDFLVKGVYKEITGFQAAEFKIPDAFRIPGFQPANSAGL